MPNLQEMLAKAKAQQSAKDSKAKKPLTRGARPDMYLQDLESSRANGRELEGSKPTPNLDQTSSKLTSPAPELVDQPSIKVEPKLSHATEPSLILTNTETESSIKLEPKLSQTEAKLEPGKIKSRAKLGPKLSRNLSQFMSQS